MTRVFLAAGVAVLAIATPALAAPGGHGGGKDRQAQAQQGGGQRQQMRTERQQMRTERPQMRVERQQMRAERPQMQMRAERHQMRTERQAQRVERQSPRVERQAQRVDRQTQRVERQAQRVDHAQTRMADRQQIRDQRTQQMQNRMVDRQTLRNDRIQQMQNRQLSREELRAGRLAASGNGGVGYGVGGCPPGLSDKGCMPPGLARQNVQALRAANLDVFRASRLALAPRTRIFAPTQVVQYVGQPVSALSSVVPLAVLPQSVSYLYPDTSDYYYRYGGGYLYQVDRGSNLVAALLPLLAGGYMPGSYLPNQYMNSYVPSYWGMNSFYPASYGAGYGYGYDSLCNRYANGVVYQVDCATGMIVDVVPLYAGGYGVGQMIPSSYGYYNVPSQYRSMYYDTSDYGYWYAPGAIYQYDPASSMITSVAALLSPGFTVGQPLPMGYSTYNVPYAYRATYYDTPNAWYRYNNGYIYQVDPATQLVTAIVASILT